MTWLLLLVTLFTMTALESCGHVTITDSEAVGNLPNGDGALFHTLTPDHWIVPKAEWDVKRIGWISIPTDWFAENKANLEKLCHASKKCDYKTQATIARLYHEAGLIHHAAVAQGLSISAYSDTDFDIFPEAQFGWPSGGISPVDANTNAP